MNHLEELGEEHEERERKRNRYLHFGAFLSGIFILVIGVLFTLRYQGVLAGKSYADPTADSTETTKKVLPEGTVKAESKDKESTFTSDAAFHILLLGIDRRYGTQTSYRSDVNLLVSFSPDRKKVLFTSIPRDLWIDGSRVNAFVTTEGIESIKKKIFKITGYRVDRYVQIDFDAFVDGVDAIGGIDVNVERGFTDTNYPNDRNGRDELITVQFNKGVERMNGERALIFARSRKGNNGEGSDFARMKRQQQILKALPEAFLSPRSAFNPFVAKNFYQAVKGRMKTDFSLEDVELAYDLVKNHEDIEISHFVVDREYLYFPSASEYGGASVLRPNGENFEVIKSEVRGKLKD